MSYQRLIQIEFNHCDPAGIVFYPRYFEMTNSVVENFFADVVGKSFAQMHLDGWKNGVPTARLECDFLAPSRLGDKVLFSLNILALGKSSLTVQIEGCLDAQVRMRAKLTLVWIAGMKAAPWPEEMRARMVDFMEGSV